MTAPKDNTLRKSKIIRPRGVTKTAWARSLRYPRNTAIVMAPLPQRIGGGGNMNIFNINERIGEGCYRTRVRRPH